LYSEGTIYILLIAILIFNEFLFAYTIRSDEMKRIALFVMLAFFITACMHGKIRIIEDEFRDETVIVLEFVHSSEEYGYHSIKAKYIRKVKKGDRIPVTLRITVHAEPDSDALSDKAYIKIDNRVHTLALSSGNLRMDSDVSSISDRIYANQFGHVVYYTNIYFRNWIILKGEIALTPELEKGFREARQVTIRLYCGDDPITIKLSDDEINKIGEFLSIQASKK
jgi:hypothetical protein